MLKLRIALLLFILEEPIEHEWRAALRRRLRWAR